MKQYLDLLQNILDNGVEKESGRTNMPNTIGISHGVIQMDMAVGFPLLTTKKMFLKGIIHELLWFLRGDTNIKYLVDNNVNIWSSDAYRWYQKQMSHHTAQCTFEEFVQLIKDGTLMTDKPDYSLGDLGKVYGYQWRNQNGVDQVKDVIEGLRDNPYSRYHIIDAWNKSDFKDMALPPCHLLYQFIVRPLTQRERIDWWFNNKKPNRDVVDSFDEYSEEEKLAYLDKYVPKFYLDLNMYQRSCDSACGIPFNLASMSLLLEIFSKASNMIPGVATWIGGDTHIYVNHVETVKEQIKRTPYKLPTIKILKDIKTLDDILALTVNDFELKDYQSHGKLTYELFVGLKANPKKV
jgi:thymidylate synthase